MPKRNQSRNESCCSWKLSLCKIGSTAAYVETYRGGKEGEEGESPKLRRELTEKTLVFCEILLLHQYVCLPLVAGQSTVMPETGEKMFLMSFKFTTPSESRL